ncbi:MAG TPA: OmpA family protein [Chitinophagales bacterium]|nr:OmpA family protein [Chitinophagales bacterium]HMZ88174.1 OmpA family protein [Chitinophagales bacterium]HNA58661.1 OmpA family protein [Chitinophagales bacterium]HNE45143.1 OmpA family protein [Chitinophagales bacterium]HNF70243.1 OmpA family protein [Chitinophagales bacterium]
MRSIITTILVAICLTASAQPVTEATASNKALKYLNEGVQRGMGKYYDKAIESFQNAIKEEPNFITAWVYLGDTYRMLGNDSMAADTYIKALDIDPDLNSIYFKRLAEAEANIGQYEEAFDHINLFLQDPDVKGSLKTEALHQKNNYNFAKEAIKSPVDFNPENMGPEVNSDFPEYFPSISVDGSVLVMTRRIDDVISLGPGDARPIDNEEFFITYFRDGAWTTSENMGAPINTKLNEGAQCISADGRSLFFTACDNVETGYGSCDIYYSYRIGNQWTAPENCGTIINTGEWESQPSVTADGRELFFSSARFGTVGSYDIWSAKMGDDGYWEEPVNLGNVINTPYSEQCPFIHPDGKTLYFSSDGHPGMGREDLFYSTRDAAGNWSKPKNLGYPINTPNQEISLSVSADGKTAFFSSDRNKAPKDLDIFTFQLPAQVQADPVTWVRATVTDERTKLPLKANVQLVDIATGNTIVTSTSDPGTGEFLIVLPVGFEYGLYVQREGYLFHSENFSLLNVLPDAPFDINVALQPISQGEILTLKNIFFETASAEILPISEPELNKVVDLMKKNPGMQVRVNGHTDNIGTEIDNQKLSQNRANSVKAYLVSKGIEDARISTMGFGESKPIDTNANEVGRANNRRTEIEILRL